MGDGFRSSEVFLDIGRQKPLLLSDFRGRSVKEGAPDQRDRAVGAAIGQPVAVDVIDDHARAPDQGDGGTTGKTGLR